MISIGVLAYFTQKLDKAVLTPPMYSVNAKGLFWRINISVKKDYVDSRNTAPK